MKIVHTEASLGWGGQEIRIIEESKGLIKRGHNISIICPTESRIFEEAKNHNVPTIALPIGRKNLKSLLALYNWLKKNRVDIINTHSSTDSWITAVCCLLLKKPPVVIRTRHISSPIPNNWASHWLYTKAVNHVVTTGEALRRQVINQTGASPSNVTSVPTGIDPNRFKPRNKHQTRTALGLNPNTNYIGIVATLRSWKGHLYLLDAFSKIENKGWELLIIGDGPMKEPIQEKIKDLKLESRVRLVGQQNNPEEWLAALDIFCLPSYANEGVPQAIIQAMLTSLPIVTTTAGAIPEAINNEETGLVIKPKDSTLIEQSFTQLICNPVLANHLGQQAQQYASTHYSLDKMLDNMQSIFQKALG